MCLYNHFLEFHGGKKIASYCLSLPPKCFEVSVYTCVHYKPCGELLRNSLKIEL